MAGQLRPLRSLSRCGSSGDTEGKRQLGRGAAPPELIEEIAALSERNRECRDPEIERRIRACVIWPERS